MSQTPVTPTRSVERARCPYCDEEPRLVHRVSRFHKYWWACSKCIKRLNLHKIGEKAS